jgi:hypothetical protein
VLDILIKYIGEDIKRADFFKRFPFFVPFIYLYTLSEDVAYHLKVCAYCVKLRAYHLGEIYIGLGEGSAARALLRVKEQECNKQ